jgi:NADH:ubiquinone oxidoreductase subunit H
MITVIRCIAARLRIDQALRFYWAIVSLLALINLILVAVI